MNTEKSSGGNKQKWAEMNRHNAALRAVERHNVTVTWVNNNHMQQSTTGTVMQDRSRFTEHGPYDVSGFVDIDTGAENPKRISLFDVVSVKRVDEQVAS